MFIVRKASTRSAVAASARPSRTAVVVRAESRRAVLSGFIAGAAALTLSAGQAQALTPIDLFDDRKVKSTGFEVIYEARDLDLPQNVRDGLTQGRADLAATKARVKASESRIDSELEPFVKRNYWTEAREQLRRQVGTLRFDLNTLAETKPKADKKKALELKKDFIANVEALDFALRSKDEASALSKLNSTKASLDNVLAAVL